ncbi:MAG: tetratricopeptide repeat protein [Cyclobacteriaceae bacterium]
MFKDTFVPGIIGHTMLLLLICTISRANESTDTLSEYRIENTELETVDSLIQVADKKNDIFLLANAFYEKADYYYYYYNKDSALHFYNLSLNIALNNKYDTLIGKNYYSIGHIFYEIDKYDQALEAANKALIIYESISYMPMIIKVKKLIADVYNYVGRNEQAINVCIELIKLYEKQEDKKGKASVLNIIGSIYISVGAFAKAEEYLTQAVELAKDYRDFYELSVAYTSFGNLYFEKKEYGTAKNYYQQSHQLDIGLEDSLGIGYTLCAMGKIMLVQDSVEKACDYFQRSLKVSQNIDDFDIQSTVLAHLGSCMVKMQRYSHAISYLQRAEAIAHNIDALPILRIVYEHYYKYYESANEISPAYDYLKKYILVIEQIKKQEDARKIAEIESLYELTEKEKQIALLTKENEIKQLLADKRKITIIELLAIIICVGIIAVVLFSRNRIKTRTNKLLEKQKEAINHQKEEIESQKNDIQRKSIALSEINHQLTASIEYAKKIQTSLFADVKELKIIFPQSFVFNKPKDIISGDFYWVNAIGDKAYLAVADCTGHGVPGAFMTILANSLLNQIILENKILAPDAILSLLDLKLKQNLLHHSEYLSSDGMDIAICIINKSNYQVEYAGAHLGFYYANSQGLQQLKGDRFPIGSAFYENQKYKKQTLQLHEGDIIYIASDGFPDQFGGEHDKKFLRVNFNKLLDKISSYNMHTQEKILENTFWEWKGECPQTDDILVMGIKL